MKLRKRTMSIPTEGDAKKVEKKPRKSGANKLPPDTYLDEIEPVEFLLWEKETEYGAIRRYLVMSVKRLNDDEGLPNVFFSMRQEHDGEGGYSGFLKGKSIHFPLTELDSIQAMLREVERLSREKGLDLD